MATTRPNGLPPNFILTPQQQNLLFRALTSNHPANGSPTIDPLQSPTSLTDSPIQNGSALVNSNGIQESPFLDYDYSFDADGSFDFDFNNEGKMIGDLPGSGQDSSKASSKSSSPENDGGDKRSHPDDENDDKDEGGGKRRESEGKVPKKPGRKPLTNEPSSKRKAQNRAAQRAFRERKEQHLKDLETKVLELEQASKTANTVNSQLRAQVEKMTAELNEYKKRMSLMNNSRTAAAPRGSQVFGHNLVNNLNEVNFQFEFPKFGMLPGSEGVQTSTNGAPRSSSFPSTTNADANAQPSPTDSSKDKASPESTKSRENLDAQSKEALSKVSGAFNTSYDTFGKNASRTSLDSTTFSVGGTNSNSPGSSSASNGGPSSSCGTSPEPSNQSPLGFKPVDTLTTIGEEQPSSSTDNNNNNNQFTNFGSFDFANFDWLAQQNNGGTFDPQLFGDYREPQDNILSSTTFDDSFFNDAFDADFSTPFNMAPSPNPPKKDFCAELDARKENEDTIGTVDGKLLTCNNIWEKLQNCPKVQTGDIDLDGLCSDLQKKAKCGGSGAVVDEKDFKAVMTKHLGVEASNNCLGSK